jgi:hypothetical protein
MSDDLPSAQRIWELAEQAVRIETALRFERGEPYKEAGKIARTLNHSEKRMFETMLGDGYAGYKNEQEISRQEFGPSGPDQNWSGTGQGEPLRQVSEQDRVLRAAAHDLDGRIQRLHEGLRDTSEDSYATRNELRDEIAQFSHFIHQVRSAAPGKIVDLTERIVDYGYDPEAAASDFMCGLEYVSDSQRAKDVYESCIEQIKPVIENLERSGIRVETGVIAIEPPDYDDYESDLNLDGPERRTPIGRENDVAGLMESECELGVAPRAAQSTFYTVKVVRLLREASAVSEIQSASERVIPTQVKQTTQDMEIGL